MSPTHIKISGAHVQILPFLRSLHFENACHLSAAGDERLAPSCAVSLQLVEACGVVVSPRFYEFLSLHGMRNSHFALPVSSLSKFFGKLSGYCGFMEGELPTRSSCFETGSRVLCLRCSCLAVRHVWIDIKSNWKSSSRMFTKFNFDFIRLICRKTLGMSLIFDICIEVSIEHEQLPSKQARYYVLINGDCS